MFIIKSILVSLAVVGSMCAVGTYEAQYDRHATTEAVTNESAYFIDESGNRWEWELEEGDNFTEGQEVTMKMDSLHTPEIEDDEILKITLDK